MHLEGSWLTVLISFQAEDEGRGNGAVRTGLRLFAEGDGE